MQEIMLAVFNFTFFKGVFLPCLFVSVLIFQLYSIIHYHFECKRRQKEWETEWKRRERIERGMFGQQKRPIKRRKDHPLTTIFKDQMPQKPTLSPNGIGPLGA